MSRAHCVSMEQSHTSFLSGANATYVSELYARFVEDPSTVDASWAQFFQELNDDGRSILAELKGAPWGRNGNKVIGAVIEEPTVG